MGTSITLFDGTEFNIEERFPREYKTVGVSLSCGVESAILLPLLLDRYGPENVHVFTAVINGRRSWESDRAAILAHDAGAMHFHPLNDDFHFMGIEESARFRALAYQTVDIDAWFAGGNKLRFSPTFTYTDPTILERMRAARTHVPFIDLLKSHTVDLHYRYHNTKLLYKSHSCTERGDIHCGECYCCWERVRGFADIQQQDHSQYNVSWESILDECYHTDKHFNKNW